MILATPLTKSLIKGYGQRIACTIGAVFLSGSVGALAWGVEDGYLAMAAAVVGLTIGIRILMTTCAVALVDAMPADRTPSAPR